MTTTKPMHSRYRIHDSQRTVAANLRRNSAINPRYWVIDKTNGEVVDQFTTRDTAQYFCTSMNCEHRVAQLGLAASGDGSGRCLNDGKTDVGGRWVCGVHSSKGFTGPAAQPPHGSS